MKTKITQHHYKMQAPFKIKNNQRVFNFEKTWRYLELMGKHEFGPKFKLNSSDHEIVFKLLIYFIGDEINCSKHGLDVTKGILLNGPVGCGKTSLMHLMRKFAPPNQFVIKSTREIAAEFNQEGYQAIYKYGRSPKRIYCFDDLGVENNMKHFGNECNTISEILLQRYDLNLYEGTLTHATTNLNAQELEDLYGNRVRSRMREMFNLISFDRSVRDKRK